METLQTAQLLNETLSANGNVVHAATEVLDRLSLLPDFPYSLLSIATGGESQGQKVAAATYLKNFTRRHIDRDRNRDIPCSQVSSEFKNQLMHALLQAEASVLKVLVEVFRIIVVAEFVKENSWPELVPELRSFIQNSNLINVDADPKWKTVNALAVLHALLRPFQYFLNPKVAREPVPPQLQLIAREILVPLLAVFHQNVEKVLTIHGRTDAETERILLIICKCIYFAVRSHMPCDLPPRLPSFCHDLFGILGTLRLDAVVHLEEEYILRLKTAKRSLLIFRALVTRHRKHSDKLMPDIIDCVRKLLKYSLNVSKLDFLAERIISLAFDVISHVLETGPGWRLVSPHFSLLLESAIFPALVMNEKDMLEWEEDPDEYIRKNLPCDLEEISGWREDLFTARKSAINLLGVISLSKGPHVATSNSSSAASKRKKGERNKGKDQRCMGELVVLPFLSKFPVPSDVNASETKIINDYYGVLMAFGGLQDFLDQQKAEYRTNLVHARVLPLYAVSASPPYLLATANWLLGELAPCLPEELTADVYSSLLKALAMRDTDDMSCYIVRASAAGAISALFDNDYLPPEWPPFLQVVVGLIGEKDEEASMLFQLLSTAVGSGDKNLAIHIPHLISSLVGAISERLPPAIEPWPEIVVRGFEALAAMVQSWDDCTSEENEQNESSEKQLSGWHTVARAFSHLLQWAWLTPLQPLEFNICEDQVSPSLVLSSCLEYSSTLLRFVMRSITKISMLLELKVSELLVVWAELIADWDAWEEKEDLSIFECIKEVVNLHQKYGIKNFFVRAMPSAPAPPVSQCSIVEGIGSFVSKAISQYPSATWRASSCVHILLHVPNYSFETGVKQSLVTAFTQAAFARFRGIRSKPCSLWKPSLLVISSCYLCYPDVVERILEKDGHKGFEVWASALTVISNSTSEHGLSGESEVKLSVLALAKVVELLFGQGKLDSNLYRDCFTSLLELYARLKEVQEEEVEDEDDDEEDEDDEGSGDEDTDDDDEDSEDDELEETEEEFLNRYAEAAVALENGSDVEEGDLGDHAEQLELGEMAAVDLQSILLSVMEGYRHILIQKQLPPPQLSSRFLNNFPEYNLFFQLPQ